MIDREKQEAFVKEYKELVSKHKVGIVLHRWYDEYGTYVDVTFKSLDDSGDIRFDPECTIEPTNRRCMGG